GDEDAANLAGGHLVHTFTVQGRRADSLECRARSLHHGPRHVVVQEDDFAGEEPAHDGVEPRNLAHARAADEALLEVRRDDPHPGAKLSYVPALAPEDAHRR